MQEQKVFAKEKAIKTYVSKELRCPFCNHTPFTLDAMIPGSELEGEAAFTLFAEEEVVDAEELIYHLHTMCQRCFKKIYLRKEADMIVAAAKYPPDHDYFEFDEE